MESQEEIKFYGPKHEHGYLSNFYSSPFVKDNEYYRTN
jgi:predicted NAD-dependent protein-ADP-ribosyltransferase YbiA (DUF1768 family)